MLNRREAIAATAATAAGLTALAAADEKNAPVPGRDGLKITKLETFLVQPRWLFLKVHTSAGIVGLGEPIVEGRADTVAAAVKEIEPYLVGKDPRQVVHHWQAIYRHAFYRGGPVLTSALSGIDMALWDIKGKALGQKGNRGGLHRLQDRPALPAEISALCRDAGPGGLRGRAVRRAPSGRRERD